MFLWGRCREGGEAFNIVWEVLGNGLDGLY